MFPQTNNLLLGFLQHIRRSLSKKKETIIRPADKKSKIEKIIKENAREGSTDRDSFIESSVDQKHFLYEIVNIQEPVNDFRPIKGPLER
jgi:hypothetical protein